MATNDGQTRMGNITQKRMLRKNVEKNGTQSPDITELFVFLLALDQTFDDLLHL